MEHAKRVSKNVSNQRTHLVNQMLANIKKIDNFSDPYRVLNKLR